MGEGRRLEREGVVLGLGRMGAERQSSRAHEMPRVERALLRGEIRDGPRVGFEAGWVLKYYVVGWMLEHGSRWAGWSAGMGLRVLWPSADHQLAMCEAGLCGGPCGALCGL